MSAERDTAEIGNQVQAIARLLLRTGKPQETDTLLFKGQERKQGSYTSILTFIL